MLFTSEAFAGATVKFGELGKGSSYFVVEATPVMASIDDTVVPSRGRVVKVELALVPTIGETTRAPEIGNTTIHITKGGTHSFPAVISKSLHMQSPDHGLLFAVALEIEIDATQ